LTSSQATAALIPYTTLCRSEEQPKIYLVMNKPRGVVTTASDEKGRATVYDLLDPAQEWISPVGRLDKASEGLLLLTNDSIWAAKDRKSTRLNSSHQIISYAA